MSSKQLSSILNRAIAPTPKVEPVADPIIVQEKAVEAPLTAEIVTLPKPDKPAKAAKEKPVEKPAPVLEPQKAIQAYVPASVAKALNIRAAEEGGTVRTIILQGLKAIGVAVPDEELRDRRK